MGFVPVKALVLIQLSGLLLMSSSFSVFGDEVELVSWAESPHHHAPSYPPPFEAPKHHKSHPLSPSPSPYHQHQKNQPPPSHPPSHPHPPSYPLPKRSVVAVEGVVYCKSCKYSGVDTLLDATPLLGAVVKLQCNNTKHPLVQEGKTDKNGYFMIVVAPKKMSNYGSHKCKVSLVSSPLAACSKPTNLHHGEQGATLFKKRPLPLPYDVFTVGPFAFEPAIKCPH